MASAAESEGSWSQVAEDGQYDLVAASADGISPVVAFGGRVALHDIQPVNKDRVKLTSSVITGPDCEAINPAVGPTDRPYWDF